MSTKPTGSKAQEARLVELEAAAIELARIARTHRMGSDEATAAEAKALAAFRTYYAERDRVRGTSGSGEAWQKLRNTFGTAEGAREAVASVRKAAKGS